MWATGFAARRPKGSHHTGQGVGRAGTRPTSLHFFLSSSLQHCGGGFLRGEESVVGLRKPQAEAVPQRRRTTRSAKLASRIFTSSPCRSCRIAPTASPRPGRSPSGLRTGHPDRRPDAPNVSVNWASQAAPSPSAPKIRRCRATSTPVCTGCLGGRTCLPHVSFCVLVCSLRN